MHACVLGIRTHGMFHNTCKRFYINFCASTGIDWLYVLLYVSINMAGLGSTKNVSTILYNGQSYSGSALANLFNDKFVAVGSTLPPFSWTPIAVDDVPSDFYISIDEVENALISVKSHSAAGPDEISPWLLRENSASLSRPLACIFNASIQEGNIPSLWKSANVSPVPKSSPALDIDSQPRSQGLSREGKGPGVGRSRDIKTPRYSGCLKF